MRRNWQHRITEGIHPLLSSRSVNILFAFSVYFCIAIDVYSQPLNPEIRITVQEDDGAVYIYHTALAAISHGFNIYRKTEDQEDFKQINLDPIRGVTSGTEFRAYLGTLYDDIERITDQSSENATLTKVRSDIRTANLLTFTYPKMAEALGRLYIDTDAPINQLVTYRLEFVDALDRPTGVVLEKAEILFPQKPVSPIYLRAENQDKRVTLYWQYPVVNENTDDKVIQFVAYRIDSATNQHEQINDKVILKNDALFEYSFSFYTASTGQHEKYYVKAVDISGQQSEPSELLHYEITDQIPPTAIIDVEANVLSDRRVQVKWQTSSNQDIAGFNLYRSSSLSDKSSYVQLNKGLLSQLETTFNDTLLANSPNNIIYYRVTALDSHGNEGPFSTAALALLEDRTPPEAPEELDAEYKDGLIELSWTQSNLPEDFETFIVLRHIVDSYAPLVPSRVNRGTLIESSIADLGIADAGFREGAKYRYEVLSTDKTGNYSQSASIEVQIPDLTSPISPNGLQVIRDNASRASVFWNPSPSLDIMSYQVYRRETGSTKIQVTPFSEQRLRYLDTTVEPGVTYEYWITAADHSGNESLPSEAVTFFMKDDTAPRNVRNVQVLSVSDTETLVRWEPVPSKDLAGYKVYRSKSMTGSFEPLSDQLIQTTQWIVQDAVADSWYKVFAIDTSGNMSLPSTPTTLFKPLRSNH